MLKSLQASQVAPSVIIWSSLSNLQAHAFVYPRCVVHESLLWSLTRWRVGRHKHLHKWNRSSNTLYCHSNSLVSDVHRHLSLHCSYAGIVSRHPKSAEIKFAFRKNNRYSLTSMDSAKLWHRQLKRLQLFHISFDGFHSRRITHKATEKNKIHFSAIWGLKLSLLNFVRSPSFLFCDVSK